MSRPQPIFKISENDSAMIKNISDTKPVYDQQYKMAVVLLESEKGTPGKIIARELGLRPHAIIDIRRKYEKLGIKLFDENLSKRAYIKEPVDERLKQLIEKAHNEGRNITQQDMADELQCSISTIKRALKRNDLKLKEDSDYTNYSAVSQIIDGFLLCVIYLAAKSGYVLFYTNNDDLKKYSKNIISKRRQYYDSEEGSTLCFKAFNKLCEFNDGLNYIVNSNLSLKEIIESKDTVNGEFVAISYGNNDELENYKIKNLNYDNTDSFRKSLAFYFKSCDINKNFIGNRVLSEIGKAFEKVNENSTFTWRMSDNHKPYSLDREKETIKVKESSEISITIKYKD